MASERWASVLSACLGVSAIGFLTASARMAQGRLGYSSQLESLIYGTGLLYVLAGVLGAGRILALLPDPRKAFGRVFLAASAAMIAGVFCIGRLDYAGAEAASYLAVAGALLSIMPGMALSGTAMALIPDACNLMPTRRNDIVLNLLAGGAAGYALSVMVFVPLVGARYGALAYAVMAAVMGMACQVVNGRAGASSAGAGA